MKKRCIAPPFLQKGDKIAIISPSYNAPHENVQKAETVLRSWGFEVEIGSNTDFLYKGCYAGTTAQRKEGLLWALRDPEIKGILCQRGGYGALHLIGEIPPQEFSSHPKWLIGYSDITTYLSMEVCAGVQCIHGPMGNDLARTGGLDQSAILLRDLLLGDIPSYDIPAHKNNIEGRARGTLVGGNIATFAPLVGTGEDFIEKEDIILFIEEVEESYHNIDRLFNMILKRGAIDRVRGIILGRFLDCGRDIQWESCEEMICSYLSGRNIPVCCGFPAGHGEEDNFPLIMGAKVSLSVTRNGARLKFWTKGRSR